jgi:HKD family nuclease
VGLQLTNPAKVLRAVRRKLPDGQLELIPKPLIPLLDTTLLTNAPGEPRVGHQIKAEIASADRIDVVMAFIRLTGINPLKESLKRHVEDGRPLRVLTTAFTGTTEATASSTFRLAPGPSFVRYDKHATSRQGGLFHRDSGYSTAYVGSSNLTPRR